MKRSAAPSAQIGLKRSRFQVPYVRRVNIFKENLTEQVRNTASNFLTLAASHERKSNSEFPSGCNMKKLPIKRSVNDILDIISSINEDDVKKPIFGENFSDEGKTEVTRRDEFQTNGHFNLNQRDAKLKNAQEEINVNVPSTDLNRLECRYYSVVWCKKSTRKHKKWEGDGILVVRKNLAVLKDMNAKVIDRESGYSLKEISSIEEGSLFDIGGKQCEIQCEISEDSYNSGKCFELTKPDVDTLIANSSHSAFKKPSSMDAKPNSIFKVPFTPKLESSKSSTVPVVQTNPTQRSIEEILDIISTINISSDQSPVATTSSTENEIEIPLSRTYASKTSDSVKVLSERNVSEDSNNEKECSSGAKHLERSYSVLWCKRSMKKNKKWEGDGVLVVRQKSAVLKNMLGKEIDRHSGYTQKEMSSIKDGSRFFIGGKECEIQYEMAQSRCTVDECLACPNSHFAESLRAIESSADSDEDAFILPHPSNRHQVENEEFTEVVVDSFLSKQLRPHQKEGIEFIYKAISGMHDSDGQGAILADEMGLGKTLQCIALIWTLSTRGPISGKPLLNQVIIITPSSLVTNWQNEFYKWLGETRLSIFAVDKQNKVKDFLKRPKKVLIISYEMFLRSSENLSEIPFDLVICDEGHRIKNLNIKISNVVNCLDTNRRILLTGTPIQNDLEEFYSIVEFVNPGALGTIQTFRRYYERPIVASRNPNCHEIEKELGDERSEELTTLTSQFILRRTQEVINMYLPPKIETVVFCRPSPLQERLYRCIVKALDYSCNDGSTYLALISTLRKLCNHPSLLSFSSHDEFIQEELKSAMPDNYKFSTSDSGKMKVIENILKSIFSAGKKEKIVIVSNFTQTLDMIEKFCEAKSYSFLRLDGSTNVSARQELVDTFNLSYTKYCVFLLSSKAGGVGFNLIGASRILLYDIDWNPAHDLQAMARVWRDGQKRPVFIYRLLTAGTVEEKIYQRQISKHGLSTTVFDSDLKTKSQFSHEELKDLFTYHDDIDCLTHDLIDCDCIGKKNQDKNESMSFDIGFTKKQVHNINMSELLKWHHIQGPITSSPFHDHCIVAAGEDISFLFVNKVNFPKGA